MSLKIQAAALLGAFASSVSAHGHVSGIVADGKYYTGYDPSFQYQASPPAVPGWSCPECLDNGFVDPTMYTDNSKIACHKDATVGQAQATVAAGGKVELQWTVWPDSHKGPVIDYLAKVDGDFISATYDSLSFFKIDQAGLDGGKWASDTLIANNNSWIVTVPSSIAPGNYVLRHEIIALHSANQANGAQNYPQCINLQVTGGGSESPAGVKANTFYTPTDPGILVNIYGTLTSYDIPGPALFDGASSGGDNTVPTATISGSVPAVTSTVASVSSAVTSVSVAQAAQATSDIAPTPVVTEAPVSATPSDAVAPIISQIASIIPTGALSGSLPLPTTGVNTTGPLPETPLPEGFTLKDLFEWIAFVLHNFGKGQGHKDGRGDAKSRPHARAFY
jgi:hypothetical protein